MTGVRTLLVNLLVLREIFPTGNHTMCIASNSSHVITSYLPIHVYSSRLIIIICCELDWCSKNIVMYSSKVVHGILTKMVVESTLLRIQYYYTLKCLRVGYNYIAGDTSYEYSIIIIIKLITHSTVASPLISHHNRPLVYTCMQA